MYPIRVWRFGMISFVLPAGEATNSLTTAVTSDTLSKSSKHAENIETLYYLAKGGFNKTKVIQQT
jgi:hypothetical protein